MLLVNFNLDGLHFIWAYELS